MFEVSKEFELEAVASGRPEWIVPTPAPRCDLAIRKDTGEWFVATGVFFKTLESVDGTIFMDSDGCTWRLLKRSTTGSCSVVEAGELYGPYGWLNGHRALSEDSWCLESDPLGNNEEDFAIPLYALADPFKEIGRDFVPTPAAIKEPCQLDRAYSERAMAAAALARMAIKAGYKAGIGTDGIETSDPEWRVVLYVETPAGQVSWHIAPSDQWLLDGLPEYDGQWDGAFKSRDGSFALWDTLAHQPVTAGLERALEWLADNAGTDHPSYPYRRDDGKWCFPYLVSNAGGFGGGVGEASFDTLLEAVETAMTTEDKFNG